MLDSSQVMETQLRSNGCPPDLRTRPWQYSNLSPVFLSLAVFLLLVGGVFFRFTNLDKKVYWHDEAVTSMWFSGLRVIEVRQALSDREIGVADVQKYQQVNPQRGVVSCLVALALDDPQHPPLYYGVVRIWAGWFGDSVATVRRLSAILSLLAFPCLYWLCRELFEERLTAWVAIALLAVSPFHVLYAQEAREYSFLTVVILLSSATLLRALRLETKAGWALYALTVVLGLYTSLLFGVVAVAHAIYVTGVTFCTISWRQSPFPRIIKLYLVAALVGLGAFLPWIVALAVRTVHLRGGLSWLAQDTSLLGLLDGWCYALGSVFLDLVPEREKLLAFVLRLPAVLLVFASLYFLYHGTRARTWLLIFSLVGVTLLVTVVPDLAMGGQRSRFARFALPCYVGVQLAVAYLLATGITSPCAWHRLAWQLVLAGLLAGGFASDVLSAQAVRWWNKGHNNSIPQTANVIKESSRPLVVSDAGPAHFGNVISLSYLLDPGTRFWLILDSGLPTIQEGFSDVFLFKPSESRIREFEAQGYEVEPTSALGLLRIRRPAAPLRDLGPLEDPRP